MNILQEILEVKKEEVRKLKREFTLNRFSDSEFFDKKTLSLKYALTKNSDISIIAEIKKASPSKGIIKNDFNHLKIAENYMSYNVDAISILTDNIFFQGKIEFLKDIAGIKTVPLLRKEFIIDEYQIYESKAYGADAVLLIAEALSKSQIQELTTAALELGMETLLEFHSIEEIDKINFELNKIIGINNRNLEDFSIDLNTTIEACNQLPDDLVIVSESGIGNRDDFNKLKKVNVDAVLIGEFLMESKNLSETIKQLKDWSRRES